MSKWLFFDEKLIMLSIIQEMVKPYSITFTVVGTGYDLPKFGTNSPILE